MRRALGLDPAARESVAKRLESPVIKHRAGRGAEPAVNRVAIAEAALATERQAREQATRRLQTVEAALREAETRRGHAELARDEAVAALAAERAARQAAEEQLRQLTESAVAIPERSRRSAPAPVPEPAVPEPAVEEPPTSAPRKRGRPAKVQPTPPRKAESEPVEWWVPGWQKRRRGPV
jgi:hypothetical protein